MSSTKRSPKPGPQPLSAPARRTPRPATPAPAEKKPGWADAIDPFMLAAVGEARRSLAEGGIPAGAALVRDGELIATGHNLRVQGNDPVGHAPIACLRHAGRIVFHGCQLYSTLMPCHLCAGAIVQLGIKRVIVGESRTFSGVPRVLRAHGVEVVDLDLRECFEMMEKFIRDHPKLWKEDAGI